MPLIMGSDLVIAQRNTYWVIQNLVVATVILTYFVLYALGFVSFLGDPIVPGIGWKLPAAVGVLLGNLWTTTMSAVLIPPLLALHLLVVLSAGVELYLVVASFLDCLSSAPTVPCGSGDEFLLIVLLLINAVYALAQLFALLSLVQFLRGYDRILRYIESEKGRLELEDQQFLEDGL